MTSCKVLSIAKEGITFLNLENNNKFFLTHDEYQELKQKKNSNQINNTVKTTKMATKKKYSKEKVIEKIKSLFSMSKSSNVNEAQVALVKARKLMDEYSISTSELIEQGIDEKNPDSKHNSKNIPDYVSALTSLVCKLFQCDNYWTTSTVWVGNKMRFRSHPVFIGFEPHLSICSYVYDNLFRKLNQARKDHIGDRISKHSFCNGWVIGAKHSIEHLIPERIMVEVQTENGLVPVDALKAYLTDLNIEGDMSSRSSLTDNDSMISGYAEGKKVKIQKPIGEDSDAKMIGN